MGLVDLHASPQLADLPAFLVRGANSDITMVELNTDGLDFQGLELPVLSRAEMLEQDWDLENSSRGKVGDLLPAGEEAAKRGREGEDESMVNKRARTEVEKPTEETVMGPPEELVAEAPGWRARRPEVLVTPAVEEEARRLTPPNQLHMAEVVEEPGLVEQARVEEQAVAEEQAVEVLPVEPVPEEQPAGFLQPPVPAPGRRPRGPRTSRLVVDEVMQLPAGQIRESLQDGWRRSLRCEHAGQDLATRDQPRPVSLEGQEGLGELLGAQARELLRRAATTRARTWDWEAAAQVVEEQEDVQEQQEVPEPAGAPEELMEGSRRQGLRTSLHTTPESSRNTARTFKPGWRRVWNWRSYWVALAFFSWLPACSADPLLFLPSSLVSSASSPLPSSSSSPSSSSVPSPAPVSRYP